VDNANQSTFNQTESTEQQSSSLQAKTNKPVIKFMAIAVIVSFAVLIATMLYLSYQERKQTDTRTPSTQPLPSLLEYEFLNKNIITWDESVTLMNNCVVKFVTLSKAGDIGLVLNDDKIKGIEGFQKRSEINDEANKASAKCGYSIDIITEE
jgi:hypothetical protein